MKFGLRQAAVTLGTAGMLAGGALVGPASAAPTVQSAPTQASQPKPKPQSDYYRYQCCRHHYYFHGYGPPDNPGSQMDDYGWWVYHDGSWDRVPHGYGCGYWEDSWHPW